MSWATCSISLEGSDTHLDPHRRIAELESALSTAQREKQQSLAQLSTLQEAHRKTSSDLKSIGSKYEQSRDLLAELSERLQTSEGAHQKELRSLRDTVGLAKQQAERSRTKETQLQSHIQQLEQQLIGAQNQVELADAAKHCALKDANRLKDANQLLDAKCKRLSTQVQELQAHVHEQEVCTVLDAVVHDTMHCCGAPDRHVFAIAHL
jgi:chromosome segregation ATPase